VKFRITSLKIKMITIQAQRFPSNPKSTLQQQKAMT